MIHASESQHWYTRDGVPLYEIRGLNGSMRPTTLRDARKIGLVPSVTSIIGCCAKPGLERWKLEQMMHAALTLPRLVGEPEAQWIERVWADSKETARKAAERGTAIHAAIQNAYEGTAQHELYEYVSGAIVAVNEWRPDVQWTVEKSFASRMGYGGKLDLHSYEEDTGHVIDFKTKEFGPEDDLKTWDEHAMQLAAYREGLGYPEARCAICYVSVTHPGLTRMIEIKHEDLLKGWRMFYSLLHYWQAKTGYASAFERALAA